MSLTTLKHFLSPSESEPGYRKIISVLLNSIANHGFWETGAEFETFQDVRQAARATAGSDCGIERLSVVAGATIRALESCNGEAKRHFRQQGDEMQNMIAMLAQAVISISGGSDRSTEALHRLKHELEQAAATEDVQELRVRLGECLKTVCAETLRQKREAAAILVELQRGSQKEETGAATDAGLDPVTALPQASAGKVAFSEGLRSPGRKYILVIVVDRMQFINSRFGKAVGDEVLKVMRKHIESKVLKPGDRLFRWGGPTLVALMARQESIDLLRGALKHGLDTWIEHEFDTGARTANIRLSVGWSVFALIPPAVNVPACIDTFVAAQIPRDYC